MPRPPSTTSTSFNIAAQVLPLPVVQRQCRCCCSSPFACWPCPTTVSRPCLTTVSRSEPSTVGRSEPTTVSRSEKTSRSPSGLWVRLSRIGGGSTRYTHLSSAQGDTWPKSRFLTGLGLLCSRGNPSCPQDLTLTVLIEEVGARTRRRDVTELEG